MPIEHRTVESAAGLVELVTEIRRGLTDSRPLWYRGHQCSAFTLTPSLYRENPEFDDAIQRERRLITRFRQRSLPFWPAGYPQTDWEHLFAMQHNGVPTRLLDWSENLFVALYFALHPTHTHQPENPEAPCHPVVWCLDPVGWNRAVLREYAEEVAILTTGDPELEKYRPELETRLLARPQTGVAIYGTHNSQRIVAQRGTFTIAGKNVQPMETICNALSNETLLWRIEICGDKPSVTFDLSTIGVTESMVYPDLPGLALELRSQEW